MTNQEKQIELNSLNFKKEIIKISRSYSIKCLEISNYRIYNAYTNAIIDNLEKAHLKKALEPFEEDGKTFDIVRKEIKHQSKSYDIINTDLVYKLHFQFFEEFLSEIIYYCLKTFPKYLYSSDQKTDLPYDRIFETNSSIENIQDYVISNKVKSIIQSNNILDIISKIEKLFSIKFDINNAILDILFVSALNRNILTHNNGIVNEIYLGLMKFRKIKTHLAAGDSIYQHLDDGDLGRDNHAVIVEIISKCFQTDSKRLIIHHNSLL